MFIVLNSINSTKIRRPNFFIYRNLFMTKKALRVTVSPTVSCNILKHLNPVLMKITEKRRVNIHGPFVILLLKTKP